MGEFKDGAFRLAIEAQANLVPLCVCGTDTSIRVNSWRMHKGIHSSRQLRYFYFSKRIGKSWKTNFHEGNDCG